MTAHPITEPDALVRCTACGAELRVSFAVCFREGWPKCCGETMTLVSDLTLEQIDEAVMTVMGPRDAIAAGLERAAMEISDETACAVRREREES